ncbi:putative salicylate hydroxylase [Xylariaceae sp. FL0662B]|nr:putative salicylate hydroxylase [Xylariaceae sp. FL0662B]
MGGDSAAPRLDVAIVGGGIIGVMTAIGLLYRGIHVTIYERAADWHEIGAGFAFTGVARECMQRLDPALLETLSRVGQKTTSSANTRYWDAFHPRTKHDAQQEASALLFQMPEKNLAFWGAVRSHLLLAMAAQLPEGVVRFGKQLTNYESEQRSDKVMLHFADGSVADAHVLVGCDGIHSTTRELLFGLEHPASHPNFSHTVAYRTMIPMEKGIEAIGEDKALSACMHCAPDVCMMSYPVMNGVFLNIAMFAHEPSGFPDVDKMTTLATRDEVVRVVAGLSPHMTDVAQLFPEKLVKWGVFDMYEHPAPTYARGLVCIAGDAAHASSPFQGAGACMGVEDALVLCEVLVQVQDSLSGRSAQTDTNKLAVERALQAYSSIRMERSQWLVRSSREMGEMYQWRYGPTGRDTERCQTKLEKASRKLWDFSVETMVLDARKRAAAL